jgi:hypothetical protein
LRSLLINHLAKIALLVEQSYTDHRHAEITVRFQLVARYIAEAARVDGQSFAQHKFHAEISSTGQGTPRMTLLKPRGRLHRLPHALHLVFYIFAKSCIGQ